MQTLKSYTPTSHPKFFDEVVSAIKGVIKKRENYVSLHEPIFKGNELKYVEECIQTGWVSTAGKYVEKFERSLEAYTGCRRAIAVSSGTAALHASLIVAGVRENDEVLLPSLTFVATANAVKYCNAVPHFVDIAENDFCVSYPKLTRWLKDIVITKNGQPYNRNTHRRIKAIIAVDLLGNSIARDELRNLSEDYGVELIEDASQALGSEYKNHKVGYKGKYVTFSFNGNKLITTGGGGAILTDDSAIADQLKHLTTTAKINDPRILDHDQVGYNYRLPNINAALGCAQLEQVDDYLVKKRNLAQRYKDAFADIHDVEFALGNSGHRSNFWLNCVLVSKSNVVYRDALIDELNKWNIGARAGWKCLDALKMFQNCPKMDLATAKDIESRMIQLPSSVFL